MLYFRNERHLEKRFISGHLQPSLDKNSEDLAIFILEFDHVTVKIIFSLEWRREGGLVGDPGWRPTFCAVPAQDVLNSPFNSTHEPSLNYRKHN